MNDFDTVAPFYDRLAKLVFGTSIRKAQTFYLTEIPEKAKVLIIGGGTGWLLAELITINPSCSVCYVEASAKMIELSKNKVKHLGNNVSFIHGDENDIPKDTRFDVAITHFYLDMFSIDACDLVIQKIKSSLQEKNIWLVTDFVNMAWWHTVILKVMYTFFKMMSAIQAYALPDWCMLMEKHGFTKVKCQKFYGGFITSALFVTRAHP